MFSLKPKIELYSIGCIPSSVSDEILIQNGWYTFLIFESLSEVKNEQGFYIDKGIALVECKECSSTKFGYPNDEGCYEHSLYKYTEKLDSGIIRASNTEYLNEINTQMDNSKKRIWGSRNVKVPKSTIKYFHFLIFLKESTFECISSQLKVHGYYENSIEAVEKALEIMQI